MRDQEQEVCLDVRGGLGHHPGGRPRLRDIPVPGTQSRLAGGHLEVADAELPGDDEEDDDDLDDDDDNDDDDDLPARRAPLPPL